MNPPPTPHPMQRMEDVFQRARRLPLPERDAFLLEECAFDDNLRRQVQSLLDHLEQSSGAFLSGSGLGSEFSLRNLSDAPTAAAAPTRLGRYKIIRKIGEGGMGVVYLAEQDGTQRMVALKVLRLASSTEAALRRFELEAKLLARLAHPGIAQVYEAGIHEDSTGRTPFIAMELVDGVPLHEWLKRGGQDESAKLALFVHICNAVQHAHLKGVVHRDLKPANILVTGTPTLRVGAADAERRGTVKILDLGVARASDSDVLAATRHTATGQLVGTLFYMSPEQAAGDPRDIDARSDVYALGVILYEMLAGRLPYGSADTSLPEMVRVIREQEALPLSRFDRTIATDLSTIVAKALEKDRTRRYQSAAELADDISRYLNRQPILAHPPSAMYQLRKFAQRHRTLVAASALIALTLVAATIVSLRQAHRAAEARALAEEHFADAHQLARTILFEIDRSLVNVTGALPARRVLVERGTAYLDKIAAQSRHDPNLQAELAAAYIAIGDVQGDTQRPNIGDADGALMSYRAAVDLLRNLGPELRTQTRSTLFIAISKIGDQLSQRADFDGAISQFQQALALSAESGDTDQQATAHARIADALNALGRPDEARRHFRLADDIALAAIARQPDRPELKRDLAITHFKRGMACLSLSTQHSGRSTQQAMEEFTAYLSIVEELAQLDPSNAVYQRDVAIGCQRLGNALEALGRTDEALRLYERELAIIERLAASDPDNFMARAEIASPCCKIGELHLAKRELQTARRYFDRYLEVASASARQNPSSAAMQRELGVAHYKLNEWHAAQARDESLATEVRLEHWRQAKDWLERCVEQFEQTRAAGLLAPSDAGVPDEIRGEIQQCDEAIARLGG